jgi:hypothetical protein
LTTASPQEFLDKYLYGLKPPEGELEKLVAALTSHTAFGATFSSLQDGIGLTLHASYRELYDWFSSIELPTVPRKRPGRPKKQGLTEEEETVLSLLERDGEEHTPKDVALELGVTLDHVLDVMRNIQAKGIQRIKPSSADELQPWHQAKKKW